MLKKRVPYIGKLCLRREDFKSVLCQKDVCGYDNTIELSQSLAG